MNVRSKQRRRVGLLLVGVTALTAACGGDDDASEADSAPGSVATTAPGIDTVAPTTDETGAPSDGTTATSDDSTSPSDGTAEPTESATGAVDAPVDPDATLRYVGTNVLSQWDPTLSINQTSDYIYYNLVYDHLIQLNADNSLSPALATSWSFSDDGLQLTMELRSDVTFHDGGKFDANNAVANLDRNRTTGILASTLTSIESVTAVDADTIRIDLVRNDPTIVYRLATTSSAMVSPAGLADPESLALEPAGSGAFKFVSYDGTTVELERNEDYWDDAHPYAARMALTQYQDDTARLNAFKTGAADIVSLKPTTWGDAQDVVSAGEGEVELIPGFSQFNMYLNANNPPLDNPLVRKAMSMAIDRESINEAILGGTCTPSTQVIPEGFVGHVAADEGVNGYDPEGARQLLEDAGVEPFTLSALVVDSGVFGQLGSIMQDQLQQIGITLELTVNPVASLRPEWRKGQHDMMVLQFTPRSPDAIDLFDSDFLGVDSLEAPMPEFEELVEAARPLPVGSDERAAALEAATAFLNEEPLHIPVCQVPGIYLYRSNVVGADNVPNSLQSADVPDVRYLYVAQS